jgi:hypothetical protein
MPGYLWRNPNPPYQTFGSTNRNDPNVPAGYVKVNSDGAFYRDVQNYQPGGASGGNPKYAPPGYDISTNAAVKATLLAVNGTAPGGQGY